MLSETTTILKWISGLLKTGRYFLGNALYKKAGFLRRENFEGYCRAWEKIITLAKTSRSRVIYLDRDDIAFTSI